MIYETTLPAGVAESHNYSMLTEDTFYYSMLTEDTLYYSMLTEDTLYTITFTSFDPDVDRESFAAVVETFTPIAGGVRDEGPSLRAASDRRRPPSEGRTHG